MCGLPEPPLYAGTISAPRDTEGRDRTSALTKLTFQRRKQRVSHTCQVRLGVLRKFSKQETGRMDRDRGVTGGGADKATCKWRPGSQEPCGHLREKQSQRREQQVQRLRHGASLAASRPVELAQGDGLRGQWCQIREGFRSSKGLVLRGGTGRSMHDTGCLGLVHWDDPEGWYGPAAPGGVSRTSSSCPRSLQSPLLRYTRIKSAIC